MPAAPFPEPTSGTGGIDLAGALARLPRDLPTLCLDDAAAARVRAAGAVPLVVRTGEVAAQVRSPEGRAVGAPADVERGTVAGAVLDDDELTAAGDGAEELLARVTDLLRPAGMLVATVAAGPAHQPARREAAHRESPGPSPGPRTFTTREVEHLLLHRGLAVERLEERDGRILAVARAPVGEAERSSRFIASLPFKLVTAAVLCRDTVGRVLCVFDTFKRHWTIPGGVVDAGEDPRSAAVREAFEEGGLRVRAGDLLGVFCTAWPDRLLHLYAASPLDPDDPALAAPKTRHPHEIGEVAWLPVADALARLTPTARWQVQRCLEAPGETWRE